MAYIARSSSVGCSLAIRKAAEFSTAAAAIGKAEPAIAAAAATAAVFSSWLPREEGWQGTASKSWESMKAVGAEELQLHD